MVIQTVGLGAFIFPLLAFAADLAYRGGCLYAWSATLGIRMMGIEIRNKDGDRVDANEVLFHSGLYIGITLTGFGVPATAIAMLINERGQGLQDMVLETTAINRPTD